jgi:hypothetical protein
MQKFEIIALCLIILLSLTGCKVQRSNSFLSNLACPPPCWEDIRPGETTVEQTLVILQQLPDIDQKEISTHGEAWNTFENIIYFHILSKKIDGFAYILDQKVALLLFVGELDITFDEASQKIGLPKFVINIPTYSGPPGIPSVGYSITAFDPEKGIGYSYNTAEIVKAMQAEVEPDIPIRMIIYFDPRSYDHLLDGGIFSMSLLNRNDTLKNIRPWDGYGPIEKKYPPAVIK